MVAAGVYRVGRLVLIPVVVVVVILVMTSWVIKSDWLYSKVAEQVKQTTGYELQLDREISISSLFPEVTIHLPSAIMKSEKSESVVRRLRLQNVTLTIPTRNIRSDWLTDVSIQVESITAIAQRNPEPDDSDSRDTKRMLLSDSLKEYFNIVSRAGLTATVKEIIVVDRQADTGSAIYTSMSNRVMVTPENLRVTGSLIVDDARHTYRLNHRLTSEMTGVSSEISLILDAEDDASEPYVYLSTQQIEGDTVSISSIELTGDRLSVAGHLKIDFSERLSVSGDIEVKQMELSDFGLSRYLYSKNPNSQAGGAPTELFSDDFVDLLQYADFNLSLSLGAVRFNNQPIVSGELSANGTEEAIRLVAEDLSILGGRGDFSVDVESSAPGQKITVNSKVEQAQVSRLQLMSDDKPLFSDGDADVKLSMRLSGSTERELARSLNGYMMMGASNVELSQRYAEQLDRGIVSFVLKGIKRFGRESMPSTSRRKEGTLALNCASLKFIVNNGRLEATDGLVVDLPENVLISSGYIDLHSETLGFAFRTKKKKILDWSALSLIKFVDIGGQLAEPRLLLDRKTLLKEGLITSSSMLVGSLPPLVYRLADAGLKRGDAIQCRSHLF